MISYVANLLMLGWFAKLPGLGHLWFVTMIMVCYVSFSLIGKNPEAFKKPIIWVVLCLPLHIIVANMGLPGYFFLILLYCNLTFLYAGNVIKWLNVVPTWIFVIAAILLNSVSYLLIYYRIAEDGTVANYVTTFGGMAIFAFLYKLFKAYSPNKLLYWMSGISYELYLVHHPFCLGKLSFFKLFPTLNDYIVSILIIIVSVVCAYILKQLSSKIYNLATIIIR